MTSEQKEWVNFLIVNGAIKVTIEDGRIEATFPKEPEMTNFTTTDSQPVIVSGIAIGYDRFGRPVYS